MGFNEHFDLCEKNPCISSHSGVVHSINKPLSQHFSRFPGRRRGDVEIKSYLQDAAGHRSLVFDLSITHDRIGSSSQQNGLLSHAQDLDAPLRLAAQRKVNSYRQQYADNQNISFLPAIMTTSSRMHGEFLRLLFYRPTARPRRTSLPLDCHRNKTDRTMRSGSNAQHSTWA